MAEDQAIEKRDWNITPVASVEDTVAAFQQYQKLKHELADADDFQRIGDKQHPKKSFVRKVQRFFALSVEIVQDEPLRDGQGNIVGWTAKARATHLPSGQYQDSDGSCEMSEKIPQQATVHNVRAHAVTRAKNRAVLDLVGFGDVSAEEIGQAGPLAPQRQKPSGGNRSQSNQSKSSPPTHDQGHGVCPVHGYAWFQRGQMKTPAHPIDEGGWCNKKDVESEQELPWQEETQ